MTDPKAIAESYIALWNETDPAVRKQLLARYWVEGATYVDPLMAGSGTGEIETLIEGVQQRFPNFSFNLIGQPDGYGNRVRFSWSLGPGDYVEAPIEGTDFAVLKDGRIASVTGFLDKVPPM